MPAKTLPSTTVKKPKKAVAGKEHAWSVDKWVAMPTRTCGNCGATHQMTAVGRTSESKKYVYYDASGKRIESFQPLPCPIYMASPAEVQARLRATDERVVDVDERVDTHEDRLVALEVENATLREQVEQGMRLDMAALAEWIEEQVKERVAEMLTPATPIALPPVAEATEVVELDDVIEAEFDELGDSSNSDDASRGV